jgi:hypothetical protein
MQFGIKKLNLKGNDRYETLESYSILGVFIGAIVLSGGIALTVLSPQGISAILSMLGALVAFCSSVLLVLVWLIKDIFAK